MKKLLILFVAALSLCACNTRKEQLAQQINSNDSLRSIVEQKENELNDLISTLNEVQNGFDAINAAEGRINVARQRGEGNSREVMRESLAEIQKTMQVNRELIAALRQQLKESSIYTSNLKTSLEETINRLTTELETKTAEVNRLQAELEQKNATIAQQSEQITNLNNNVRDLNNNVRELDKQNTQRAQTVAQQDKDLHTAYYVFGTKKELKEQHILADGEVLRSGNFAKDYFTKIDTRSTKVIHLYSKNASLRTNHPSGTYSLDKDANGQYTLRITDPDRFWSTSKYLVIVVK
ncbi:MAG: hypothetical protein MJZ54_07050 [Bacteroidaceae bacterium]|nr:hypothetical protein [Bacteroidaceae bacterium]